MGIVMVCDRCTKPITGDIDDRRCKKMVVTDRKSAHPKDNKQLWSADLCDSCNEAVKDFIFDHKEEGHGGRGSTEAPAGTPRAG